MAYVIEKVSSRKGLKHFIDLPWQIYREQNNWIPPLKAAVKAQLHPKHPFFENAEMEMYLVKEGRDVVGRIAGIINHAHNQFHQENSGHFGFFESFDDKQIAQALFSTVEESFTKKKMDLSVGPFNPSTNYECGLLVDNFDDPAQIMMTFNPPYYVGLIEKMGYTKAMDLLAYRLPTNTILPERIVRIGERIEKSHNITWRHLSKKNWDQEVELFMDIYNNAWEKNWGFVPVSKKEFYQIAKDLKMIVQEELTYIVEVHGKPAGILVALPDYNQIMQKIPSGNLFPTGLYKLMTGRKHIDRFKIVLLGIKHEYKALGLSTLIYNQIAKMVQQNLKQYKEAEMSWILETNEPMNKPLRLMNAHQYKTYRLYQKSLRG